MAQNTIEPSGGAKHHINLKSNASAVPFTLTEGKEIIVCGTPTAQAEWFKISLCVCKDNNSQIPFMFHAKFKDNVVARNHKEGDWGKEYTDGGFPFAKSKAFEVKFVVRGCGYQVYVNNVLFTDFTHRLPKESVKNVVIEGDVTIDRVSFLDTINNPAVPFCAPIHGELYPGRKFMISGVPTGDTRFNVNFVCGTNYDKDDVVFHLDGRFRHDNETKLVVCNHRDAKGWQLAQADIQKNNFPFSLNVPFEMTIVVDNQGFTASVNNKPIADFKHRIQPYQRATHLHIVGDVRLTEVKL